MCVCENELSHNFEQIVYTQNAEIKPLSFISGDISHFTILNVLFFSVKRHMSRKVVKPL